MEQTGTLRRLAGARSLSPFIRNGDSRQTDPCLPSLTGLGGKDYGVDLPVAAYVTVPRSFARRAMICSPPTLRTIGNSSGVGLHVKRKVRSCAAKNLGRSPTPSLASQDLPIAQIREAVCDSNHRISRSATAIITHRFSRSGGRISFCRLQNEGRDSDLECRPIPTQFDSSYNMFGRAHPADLRIALSATVTSIPIGR